MTRADGAPRIGLVLGAGGVAGHAFEAGVLAALADRTPWQPDDATVIVGTSAGSAVGALVRAGLPASDLAARTTGDPLSPKGRRLLGSLGPPHSPQPRPELESLRMAAPEMLLNLMSHPWDARIGTVASAVLPEGRLINHALDPLGPLYGDNAWPRRTLWVCALRLRDGRRVVFGRDGAPACHVAEAVNASCAIPGWFAPVVIAGERHVDGGAHSPSNLDALAGHRLDLIVVVSPMSAESNALSRSVDALLRRSVGMALAQERWRVQTRGARVLIIEPGPRDLEVMGPLSASMEPARRAEVTRRARETTHDRLDRPDVRTAIAPLYG
jgi:NTE family protein